MKTKYTPGPLRVEQIGELHVIRGLTQKESEGFREDYWGKLGAADKAEDAQLWAAAPELAEALCDCIRELVAVQVIDNVLSESRGLPKPPEREALKNARHALHKAGLVS